MTLTFDYYKDFLKHPLILCIAPLHDPVLPEVTIYKLISLGRSFFFFLEQM